VDLHKVHSGVFHLTLLHIPRGLILGALYSESFKSCVIDSLELIRFINSQNCYELWGLFSVVQFGS
jgi:hypothetical protein